MDRDFQSFEDFWPFYVHEHANKTNRRLHFVGTSIALGCVAAGLVTGRKAFFLAAPVAGYGFAWVGHFVFEKNRPATFKHPLWSLRGDFKMWAMTVAGKMDEEVDRVMREYAAVEAAEEAARTGVSPDPVVN